MAKRKRGGSPADRRAAPRDIAVLRVAKLVTSRGEQLCRIRNISPGGVMAEVPGTYFLGESAGIELKSGGKAAGHIAWVEDGRIGVSFEEPIDPQDILAIDPDHPPRALRIAVSTEASLCLDGSFRRVEVVDVALGGVRVRLDDVIEIGSRIFITIEGLPNLAGGVRWQSGGYAGIAFEKPLDLDTLAFWLAGRPFAPSGAD
jgi:hypothetical protein